MAFIGAIGLLAVATSDSEGAPERFGGSSAIVAAGNGAGLLSPCSLSQHADQPNNQRITDPGRHVLPSVESLHTFVKLHGQRRGSIFVSHNLNVRSSVALRRDFQGLVEFSACSDAGRKPVVASKRVR